jgi:predicted nucleotidyltransferase
MRTDAAGQSALLMVDVAEVLATRGIPYAVIGAMAAAVHGVVRASLDADALVGTQLAVARELQREFIDKGYAAELRVGDMEDPIPALLAVTDPFANRVDLLIGLRGLDVGAMDRVGVVSLAGFPLTVIGREDFIAMKAHAGGPVDLADARAVVEIDPAGLDRALIRRIAAGFGAEATRRVESLLEDLG